jgi:hypothetical protein
VLALVARQRPYQAVFAVLAAAITIVYTLILPSVSTKQVGFTNWQHLGGLLPGFSIALGIGLAAVLTLQVFAIRQAAATRRAAGGRTALGGAGFLASLIPSLCCTAVGGSISW